MLIMADKYKGQKQNKNQKGSFEKSLRQSEIQIQLY
jgi:hypothetical protein